MIFQPVGIVAVGKQIFQPQEKGQELNKIPCAMMQTDDETNAETTKYLSIPYIPGTSETLRCILFKTT